MSEREPWPCCTRGICGWCGGHADLRVADPTLLSCPEFVCSACVSELPEDEQAEYIPDVTGDIG